MWTTTAQDLWSFKTRVSVRVSVVSGMSDDDEDDEGRRGNPEVLNVTSIYGNAFSALQYNRLPVYHTIVDTPLAWNTGTSQGILKRKVWFRICAGFSRDDGVNFRNQHMWADENSHAVEETKHQHRFSINVRAGVLGDRLRAIRATTEINWDSLSGLPS
ncbi:hypothetical protein ANN_11102 [Periplaneta americana]|uniref:Uncharacterized protein n=1 Tax=Periplaneta americana TaxID=6978 RepID=A0ABQ8T424_PERAM|nr:hypothetical protein ANN_11102 [Periplaneta americana]